MLGETPVVILAGGLGTRLRPAVSGRPKALAPIGERPFLQIQMELLRDQGARRFVLCVGYLADQVREFFGNGSDWGVQIDYSIEGDRLLGTGGALKLAECFFQPRALVLNGDTYLAIDYQRLLERQHEESQRSSALATLTLAQADDASRFGTILLDETGRFVIGFREKEATADGGDRWLNAGAYVIERALLDRVRPGMPLSLERDVFPDILQAGGRIAAVTCTEAFYDIGTPRDLQHFAEGYARGSPSCLAAGLRRALPQRSPEARG